MSDRTRKVNNNVARADIKQKQQNNKTKTDKSKSTSLGSKAWERMKVALWIWNAAKSCFEFLEGDAPDITESGDEPP